MEVTTVWRHFATDLAQGIANIFLVPIQYKTMCGAFSEVLFYQWGFTSLPAESATFRVLRDCAMTCQCAVRSLLSEIKVLLLQEEQHLSQLMKNSKRHQCCVVSIGSKDGMFSLFCCFNKGTSFFMSAGSYRGRCSSACS